jgi:SAM-dependent methyltransferase
MINLLHSLFHEPRRGWDPVSAAYAANYQNSATGDPAVVEWFGHAIGGFAGKRIVDLGSGPGQYALEFARRGAYVTCVDVSAAYLAIASRALERAGLRAGLVLGYMDHVEKLTSGDFDAAFSHASWYYCMNDLRFARAIMRVLRPGGVAWIRANTDRVEKSCRFWRRFVYCVNNRLYWKLGHPHPPRGRIAHAFSRLPGCTVEADYRDPLLDVVVARKASGSSTMDCRSS